MATVPQHTSAQIIHAAIKVHQYTQAQSITGAEVKLSNAIAMIQMRQKLIEVSAADPSKRMVKTEDIEKDKMDILKGRIIDLLEGSIQVAMHMKRGPKDQGTTEAIRQLHNWAHDLAEAEQLPFNARSSKGRNERERALHKIEFLGQCLQQMDFGNGGMRNASSDMGATVKFPARRWPSTHAGRSGDALWERELDRFDTDDEKDTGPKIG